MVPLNSAELDRLSKFLAKYDRKSTVRQLAGLLTVPGLQANTLRIETVAHLAVAHCQGTRKPGLTEIGHWLNRQLGRTEIAVLEDPVEDVFVSNVETPEGNRRLFEGIWESSAYCAQVVVDTLLAEGAPDECRGLVSPILALLTLSDCLAERLDLHRWQIEPSEPKGLVRLAPAIRLDQRSRAVSFSAGDLEALGIHRDALEPFIFGEDHQEMLGQEVIGHSSLEAHPLVEFGDEMVLVLPHAVSPAIRRYVLRELLQKGYLSEFADVLSRIQAGQLEQDGLWELKRDSQSLKPPQAVGQMPPLHTWLLRYDVDKYLHVLLLQDNLRELEERGLSSFLEYPASLAAALEGYLNKVADHCCAQPGFSYGMTLVVMGGLGRGYAFRVKTLPDNWGISFLSIADLLMLATELERPVKRYLKCIRQKEWAEGQGVYFQNVNGDYNFYCFWRRGNYQLVPRELRVADGSMLSIGTDMVLPVRKEVRRQADHHVLPMIDGQYVSVMRYGREAYFQSMQDRPIYASLGHIRRGILAGAVETPRGTSWLRIVPRDGDARVRHTLYELWSGFISLFDRLVFEIEACYPDLPNRVVEISLDFEKVLFSEDQADIALEVDAGEADLRIHNEQNTATIWFPSEFLSLFQQPENVGERFVIRAVARSLIGLHQMGVEHIDQAVLGDVVEKVIGDSSMRVLHLFRTFNPVEYLLSRQTQQAVFLPHEDFVFAKLGLSDGCVPTGIRGVLEGKGSCNDFLKKVVVKVWTRLRDRLQQLSRSSVIREMLVVYEAAIQDRDHWRRTAQAVLALYSSSEDVHDVAQKREIDRTQVSLAARTILEMAVCECPVAEGGQLSKWQSDELLALAALLVEVATDSDAVNTELIEPHVGLHPNGEYSVDRGFHEAVIKPFQTAYFREEFEEAAGSYARLYQRDAPKKRVSAEDLFSSEFITAFRSEFGLSPDEAIEGFSELMDLAIEQDSVVVETTLGLIKTRLATNRGLSNATCDAFLRTFALFHRPSWDKPPAGFSNKDINPWRFRRRLSATAKPLLVFGENDEDMLFFGAGALGLGFGYVLERSERGHLPQEFFRSKEMKEYIGRVSNERGHDFARSVADRLRTAGWQTRHEVQMTELGGAAELGDVDVLAWKPSGEIRLIECKRLQLARTVAEVAEICRRFRGEAKDELDRHVQRVKWIHANPAGLARIVGFTPDPGGIDDRLVTNTHVPMMYLESLPIDVNKIGPLGEIEGL